MAIVSCSCPSIFRVPCKIFSAVCPKFPLPSSFPVPAMGIFHAHVGIFYVSCGLGMGVLGQARDANDMNREKRCIPRKGGVNYLAVDICDSYNRLYPTERRCRTSAIGVIVHASYRYQTPTDGLFKFVASDENPYKLYILPSTNSTLGKRPKDRKRTQQSLSVGQCQRYNSPTLEYEPYHTPVNAMLTTEWRGGETATLHTFGQLFHNARNITRRWERLIFDAM